MTYALKNTDYKAWVPQHVPTGYEYFIPHSSFDLFASRDPRALERDVSGVPVPHAAENHPATERDCVVTPNSERALLAVLTNPPLTTGTRTLRRTALVAEQLGFAQVHVVNLFAVPSHATGEIAALGLEEAGWLSAREAILTRLIASHGVLLAYGATAPTGPARLHFRRQVDWLHGVVAHRDLPSWQVGDGPRHPSRWQRWTHRAHPGVPFEEALRASLVTVSVGSVRAAH